MPELLQHDFMVRALLVGSGVGIICPALGHYLVLRRLSYTPDALSHVALAGVGLSLLVGWSPLLGAVGMAGLGAFGIDRLRSQRTLHGETALALVLSGSLAAAALLMGRGGSFTPDLLGYLFGSLLAVSPEDLWAVGLLGGAVAVVLILLAPQLFAISFDEEAATVAGLPVHALNLILMVLTAVAVVVTIRIAGILLVGGLMVIPVATSLQVARSFRGAHWTAIGFGLLSVLVGVTAAYYLELPAGASIVATALAFFLVVIPWNRRTR